ncbi:MAG: hypothetical protein WDN29_03735 [Methylovirgula sp.]
MLVADLNAPQADTPAHRLQRHVGDAFQKLAAINIEAARERSAYLHSDPDPQPLIDVTLRLRHDIVLLGRAATEPLPPFILERLAQPIEQFVVAVREFLISAAAALNARAEAAPIAQIDAAFANFSEAFAALRRAQLLQNLPTDTGRAHFRLGVSASNRCMPILRRSGPASAKSHGCQNQVRQKNPTRTRRNRLEQNAVRLL